MLFGRWKTLCSGYRNWIIRWIVIYPLDSWRRLASEHPGLVVDHRQYSCLPYNLRIKENTNLPKQDVINSDKTNLSLHPIPGGIPGVGWGGGGGVVKGTTLLLTETIFEHDILFCRSEGAFVLTYLFHFIPLNRALMRRSMTSKAQ